MKLYNLIDTEMQHRFNPPDRLLSLLSAAFLTGLFLFIPVFFPVPELWRSRSGYIHFVLILTCGLTGPWCLGLILHILIDRLAYHPAYYTCKYFALGGLTLGIAISGILSIYWFFDSCLLTFLYMLLLCFQAISVLSNLERELLKLYGAYRQIEQGKNINLSFVGMVAFLIMMLTHVSEQPASVLFMCIMQTWTAWYCLRLAILNFTRAMLHMRREKT